MNEKEQRVSPAHCAPLGAHSLPREISLCSADPARKAQKALDLTSEDPGLHPSLSLSYTNRPSCTLAPLGLGCLSGKMQTITPLTEQEPRCGFTGSMPRARFYAGFFL